MCVFGTPPAEAQRFKRQVCALCLKSSSNQLVKTLYCQTLPNGDWRDHSCIQVWLPPGTSYDFDKLANVVGKSMIQIFASHLYITYRRQRLKRAEEAISEFGLFEACHGMLTHCF